LLRAAGPPETIDGYDMIPLLPQGAIAQNSVCIRNTDWRSRFESGNAAKCHGLEQEQCTAAFVISHETSTRANNLSRVTIRIETNGVERRVCSRT